MKETLLDSRFYYLKWEINFLENEVSTTTIGLFLSSSLMSNIKYIIQMATLSYDKSGPPVSDPFGSL